MDSHDTMPQAVPLSAEDLYSPPDADATRVAVNKSRYEYREAINAATRQFRDAIPYVNASGTRADLASNESILQTCNTSIQSITILVQAARDETSDALQKIRAARMENRISDQTDHDRHMSASMGEQFHAPYQNVFQSLAKSTKKDILHLQDTMKREDAGSEAAKIRADEDELISAVEMLVKVGKEGLVQLEKGFPGLLEALKAMSQEN